MRILEYRPNPLFEIPSMAAAPRGNSDIAEQLARAPHALVVCGHTHAEWPLAIAACGHQVLNVDGRVVILTRASNELRPSSLSS